MSTARVASEASFAHIEHCHCLAAMEVRAKEKAGKKQTQKGSGKLTTHVTKVLASTGKAAWVAGTSLLVLIVPLIIEMDREQQIVEMENQQMGVLSGGSSQQQSSSAGASGQAQK